MQPTPLTAIQVRLDIPDPGKCTECSHTPAKAEEPRRRGAFRGRKSRRAEQRRR